MECNILSTTALQPCLSWTYVKRTDKFQANMYGWNVKRLNKLNKLFIGKSPVHNVPWRVFCSPVSLEEKFSTTQSENLSNDEESDSGDSLQENLPRPPCNEELKALLADSERSKLINKLSEANQQNRFLKRQGLVSLAAEIANYSIPSRSRKINGKYIQSHLLSRLEAVHGKLKEQIKDVDDAQSKEVHLFWHGVAESVQVMGSFNGWFEGENLSPEYTGSYSTFSTTLMLRPGKYEIKFLVDGEWQLSAELPIVGEGLMQNNLLIVE